MRENNIYTRISFLINTCICIAAKLIYIMDNVNTKMNTRDPYDDVANCKIYK